MSIFTEEDNDRLKAVFDMREDQKLITEFVGAVKGAGLESLDFPAGKLIDRHLAEKYPDHYQLGSGTEGLLTLAAIIGGGYAAYKMLIRNKKVKPVVDRTKDLISKVEKQYPKDFPVKHPAVDKEIDPGQLTKYFAGSNFSTIRSSIESWLSKNDKTLDAIESKTRATYKAFEDANKRAKAAGDDKEAVKKIEADMRAKYGNAPYECTFNPGATGGKGGSVASITESEFSAARDLLLKLLERFNKVNDVLFEDMLFGYVGDHADLVDNGYIWENLQYEAWFDEVAGGIYSYIDELMNVSKSLEAYIIKSFK